MNCNFRHICFLAVLVLLAASCSTQKNTRASRGYHQMKVKYNIFHNGNIKYEEGLRAIQTACEDDYTRVLSLYPVSDHKAAESAKSQMDVTIEKCRKCIKLHSIKAKPKPDPKRRSDPKYRAWLKQEEFNNQMSEAWIRLGEAEFHKGDFLGSVGTFNYVIRHYEYGGDVVARCQLMVARAYAEMGWQYEAEDMLSKVQQDALKQRHAHLYGATSADVLIHAGQYKQAIPFLKIAVPHEKRKVYRPRFQYVLAQLYQLQGQKAEAIEAYRKVIGLAPLPTMDFHARLNMAQLQGKAGIKGLKQMTRQSKHKDHLDVIYGTMANIYLQTGDTAKAKEYYQTAIDTAKNATLDKAGILVRAGDLYFEDKEYDKAQPCYREALTIFSSEHPEYKRLSRRAEVLDGLIGYVNTVTLQDSLQALSRLTEEEQIAAIEQLLKAQEEQRKKDSARLAQQAREEELNGDGPRSVNTANMIGNMQSAASWYFYNPQLMRQGKQEFRRKWGSRPLEDQWRRQSKALITPMEESYNSDEQALNDSLPQDSAQQNTMAADIKMYYDQIPHTPEAIHLSDSLIEDALVAIERIYRYDLRDTALAEDTHRELMRRFPSRPTESTAGLADQALLAQLDSLYELTYQAYRAGRFAEVKERKQQADQMAATGTEKIMPRFHFLAAVSAARTEGQNAFAERLHAMVERYPEHELSAKAKDMLAMMGQGQETKKGGSMTDLADARQQAAEEAAKAEKETEPQVEDELLTKPMAYLILPAKDEKLYNALQYEVALFNFEVFLLRDFEFRKQTTAEGQWALAVGAFESKQEAEWWLGLILKNDALRLFIEEHHITTSL